MLKLCLFFLLVAVSVLLPSLASRPAGGERKVGGRSDVPNVGSNREVQELGRFCVEQYNRRLRGPGSPLLAFSRVVAAQRQVVAGLKYYLRIAAIERNADTGAGRTMFDAVVVLKPWLDDKKRLVSFTPSAAAY